MHLETDKGVVDVEMLDIKMLKDNGRTVIIISGADRDRDEIAYQIVSAYIGAPVTSAPTGSNAGKDAYTAAPTAPTSLPLPEVQGLELPAERPVEIPSEEQIRTMEDYSVFRQRGRYVISAGTYKGMTAFSALQQDNERALVSLYDLAKEMQPCEEKREISAACRQYMANLPGYAKELYPDRDSKIRFFQNVASMAPINQFINGYPDLNAFCLGATGPEIDITFYNFIWYLSERGRRA